jgi:3-oxoacyl-[acyl-carrier protein] reductase
MQLFDPGSVAAVAGGSSGIGAAVVRALAAEGVEVIFTYHRGEKAATALAAEIAQTGGQARAHPLDVTDEAQVRAFFREIRRVSGRLDVFVGNAGSGQDGLLASMPLRQFKDVLEVNVVGTFLCCREALRVMAAQRSGSMVLVSSISSFVGREGQANYSAAKGAVSAFTRVLAIEGARYGVRVNSVSPGFVETPMTSNIPEQIVQEEVLIGRMARPSEIADAIVMTASERLSYLVGADLIIDGGATISPTNRPRFRSSGRAQVSRTPMNRIPTSQLLADGKAAGRRKERI